MRGRFAGALLLGVAGIAAANAADLTGGPGGYGDYWSFGARMEPVIVYDFEPGVIVRSYWYPPLDNRHYFPRTAAGQSSVVLSTGLRAGFRNPNRTIATGRYRRFSRLSRSRLDTLPQDRHSDRGRDSSAQAPARNVERERGRIGDIQTLYLARHIDARQTIAGCFRQLS
jgi:hypothetical protein